MSTIKPTSLPVALQSLRQPIETFTPARPAEERLQASMLTLSDQLALLWSQDEDETLEGEVVWTALYAFPALVAPGPAPEELVELAAGGNLMDGETADTLRNLAVIRRTLKAFEPPGFAAALWRAVLLRIFGIIELFVLIDDEPITDRCFQLLDLAEYMADRFSGKA